MKETKITSQKFKIFYKAYYQNHLIVEYLDFNFPTLTTAKKSIKNVLIYRIGQHIKLIRFDGQCKHLSIFYGM